MLRYINRFFISGYIEKFKYYETDGGTPRGELISPIYLHYVLDLWIEKAVKQKLKGERYLVRYADNFIIMFRYEKAAKLVHQKLIQRLNKFELEIEVIKTKIFYLEDLKSQKKHLIFLNLCILIVLQELANIQ